MADETKKTITYAQYLQPEGLLTLAKRHNEQMKDIERAVAELVQEKDDGHGYYGHASDAAWSAYSATDLLENLEIPVPERSRR